VREKTARDRAIAAFGQSLEVEEWAVHQNELAWKARRSRLLAFKSREAGCSDPAMFHEQDAAGYEAQLKTLAVKGPSKGESHG
jgi:hypothetical protein